MEYFAPTSFLAIAFFVLMSVMMPSFIIAVPSSGVSKYYS